VNGRMCSKTMSKKMKPDGWRAGGSVIATLRAEDLAGGDTESFARRHHGRTPRKNQDVHSVP
jgi:hypothetical protein